jgi:hypothetical protein
MSKVTKSGSLAGSLSVSMLVWPAGSAVDRRPHVQERSLDRIGIGVADGREDLLVDVGRQRIPRAFRRVLVEDRARLVLAGTDDRVAELAHRAADHLVDVVGLPFFGPVLVVGFADRVAAGVVIVADQQVEIVPRLHVVVAVGVLADAAVDVGARLAPVAGELLGNLVEVARVDAGDLRPLFDGVLAGAVRQHHQRRLDLDRDRLAVLVERGELSVGGEIALDRVLLVVWVEGHKLAILQHDEGIELPRAGAVSLLAFLHGDAQLGAAHQLARFAVLVELDQPGRVAEVRFAGRSSRRLVGVLQVAFVVALVVDDDLDQRQRDRRLGAGDVGQPLPRLAAGLAQPRVDDDVAQPTVVSPSVILETR